MSVSTTNAYSGPFAANGSTTVFPFTFTAPSAGEVSVITRDSSGDEATVSAADYTVTLDTGGGGDVTFDTAPASGLSVYLLLSPDFTQEIEFENGSAWLAEPVNEGYDRAVARDQSLKRDVDRAIKVPLGETGLTLPSADDRASKFLAFDSDGEASPMDAVAISGAPEATVAEIRTGTASNRYLSPLNLFTSAAPVTLTDAATIAVDMAAGINFNVTIGGNRTLGNPTNAKPGQSGRIRVTQDATGGRTLAFGANWKHVGSVAAIATTSGAKNIFGYFVDSSGDIELSYLGVLV